MLRIRLATLRVVGEYDRITRSPASRSTTSGVSGQTHTWSRGLHQSRRARSCARWPPCVLTNRTGPLMSDASSGGCGVGPMLAGGQPRPGLASWANPQIGGRRTDPRAPAGPGVCARVPAWRSLVAGCWVSVQRLRCPWRRPRVATAARTSVRARAHRPCPLLQPRNHSAPSRAAAFPGQPPPGSLYYGASVPHHRSLPAWETELGTPLALNRSYFTPDHNETAQLVRRCRDDLAHGRLPHVSIKPWGTWQEIAAGDAGRRG